MLVHPIAIDPPNCGCNECGSGLYIPVDAAAPAQIARMLTGKVANNTGQQFQIRVTRTLPRSDAAALADSDHQLVQAATSIREWDDDAGESITQELTWDITDHVTARLSLSRIGRA